MDNLVLSVREMNHGDIPLIIDYWLNANPSFLVSLGVDLSKVPAKAEWEEMLTEQLESAPEKKKSYCLIWLYGDNPVGHSNVNKIIFGEEAFMHLHIWKPEFRAKGMGARLVSLTLPFFFDTLKLKRVYCEPYALNEAPNRTVKKAGFTFLKEYITTPGWINIEQPVKRWVITREKFISSTQSTRSLQ